VVEYCALTNAGLEYPVKSGLGKAESLNELSPAYPNREPPSANMPFAF